MWPVATCALLTALAVLVAAPARRGRRPASSSAAALPADLRRRGRSPLRSARAGAGRADPPLTAAEVAVLADQVAALAVAGLTPQRIWAAVAEHGATPAVRSAARAVTAGQRAGRGVSTALREYLAAAPGHRPGLPWRGHPSADPTATQLAVALDVSEGTGAAVAETLHRFAAALRADQRAAAERAAALAGPQATAGVLTFLPLAGLVLGAAVGGRPWHALLATAPGRACLLVGGTLWGAGRLWTGHLVRRASAVR